MSNIPPPRMSIVIPTLGRSVLVQTLESLVATHGFDNLEVIVAGKIRNTAVANKLAEFVRDQRNILHLNVEYKVGDSSEKKNAGVRAATADLIAFLDDDVIVAPHWPQRMIDLFNDPDLGLASGPSLVPEDVPLFARLAGVTLQSRAAGYVAERYLKGVDDVRLVNWSRIIGCNMVYRRSVFEQIGHFDPKFWPGEEMIAAFRAEKISVLKFDPEAWVYHYPRASLWRFWKQIRGYGATRIRLVRAGVQFEPTTVVPALWVLSLLLFIPLAFVSRSIRWLLFADILCYLLADAYITFTKFMETRRKVDLLIFLLVPVMHLSYGLAEWSEILRPNRDLSESCT